MDEIFIKIKTRDKKKFTKKFHGGGRGNFPGGNFPGRQFSGGNFHWEQFSGGHFSGAIFPRTD